KWNYFSLELNNNVMRAYVNGELTGVHQIQTPFENTDESLFIGNFMGYSGFYFGDIKELKLSNNLLDEKKITASWNKIKETLK
ncbi:MAG: LamG domain-containing protein, partial [Bacteroidetes bacterium]|nr:LamG domain-containing protein [Bacteroidota bacterium]